jgi:hypothetical protein
MAGPGHLRHHGRGELVIEPSQRDRKQVARALRGRRRADGDFRQCSRCALDQADPELRLQRGVGDRAAPVRRERALGRHHRTSCATSWPNAWRWREKKGVRLPDDLDVAVHRIARNHAFSVLLDGAGSGARQTDAKSTYLNGLVVRPRRSSGSAHAGEPRPLGPRQADRGSRSALRRVTAARAAPAPCSASRRFFAKQKRTTRWSKPSP